MAAPSFLDDDGKELWNDLEGEENVFSDAACETREKLLLALAGKGEAGAANERARVLLGLGICEFRKGNFEKSKKRFDNTISEMNAPSEEVFLQNQMTAPIVLTKQAAGFMVQFELTQAGTALRRCREVLDRNLKKIIKMLQKQMGASAPPVDVIVEELPGYGKTGKILPMLVKQVPHLRQELLWSEVIDISLDNLDRRIQALDASQKQKRTRLDVSKGKSKNGMLLYVRGLATEATVPVARLAVAQDLVKGGAVEALLEEAASAEKALTLIKHGKEASGCKDKGLTATCKALLKVPDVQTNGFGETRLLVVKAGKKQQLDECSTNANVGVLVAAKDGARVTVAGGEPIELKAGKPAVFDFCREAFLEAGELVPVLFVQAWHPEFAAVERTTELRARAKAFGLSEEELKVTTKVVNDHAKASWEKTASTWRKNSAFLDDMKQKLRDEVEQQKKGEEAAAEAKRREEELADEDKKKALEELERKREAKRKAKEEAEEARKKRQKQLEEERAKKDPWLNSPEVKEAEQRLEELKQARRDANAKLEFDLSTKLTKDISAAERQLKKITKQAKKAHLAGGGAAPKASSGASGAAAGAAAAKEEAAAPAPAANPELEKLRKQLAEVKKDKAKAAEGENFKEAKRLKQVEKDLEDKIKKLEL